MTRTTARNRRRGISLIEVLVAIFIMGIGLLALLTLFPLGALEMAQAIKDDRTGTAAANAAALARAVWKPAVEANPTDPDNGSQNLGITIAMLDPNQYLGGPTPGPVPPRYGLDAPSYPVYVDPFGYLKNPPPWKRCLAGAQTKPPPPAWIPRCLLQSMSPTLPNGFPDPPRLLALFSSQDELNLGDNGVPQTPVQRNQQYSWAYMVRRSSANIPTILDLTVVVYRGRSLQLSQDLIPTGENMFTADFTAGSTVVPVSWSAGVDPPAVRPGQWIMDATMIDPNPIAPATSTTFIPQGYFYRVVSVTPTGNTSMDVEIQTPARVDTHHPPPTPAPFGVALFLDNVVEVFDKPSLVP